MSPYKLIYFDGRGRAEIIRLIFTAAGVAFEDHRVPMDQWAQLKPNTPMGVLPLLETEGVTLCQSLAIARYLARKFGLAGKTELDQAKVDIVVDSVEDTIKPIPQFWKFEKDEEKKAQLKKTYIEETLPTFLTNLEKLLSTNHSGDGYFVGDSLTWADLYFYALLGRLELLVELTDPFEKFPKLKALTDRIGSQPKIAEYIAKRPKTSF